jgi:hypothetical protein
MHQHTNYSSCHGWSLSHNSGRTDGCIWWTPENECLIGTIWKVNSFSPDIYTISFFFQDQLAFIIAEFAIIY